MGTLLTLKAERETTGPDYAFMERLARPGYGQAAHVHRLEDETLILLEGEMSGFCGERQWRATAGSFVFLPRGVVHGFKIEGRQPARMYMIFSPAGFEGFYKELGVPAKELTLPPPGLPDPLLSAKMIALSARYQLELQGPLAILEKMVELFV
jgi:quercetin dioxygenase-like cupin family protein